MTSLHSQFDLRFIIRFYIIITFNPINPCTWITDKFSDKSTNGNSPIRRKLLIYLFLRFWPLLHGIQAVHLLIVSLYELHITGKIDTIRFFGLFMMLGAYSQFGCVDPFLYKAYEYLFQPLQTSEKLWKRTTKHLGNNVAAQLKFKKSSQTWRLMLHNGIDCINILNFAWSSLNIEDDQLYMRTVVPWNTPTGNVIYWIVQQIVVFLGVFVWSAMLTLPGVIAYHFECVLNALAESVNVGPTRAYSLRDILKDYQSIEYSIRELHRKGFAEILLFSYILTGVQQAITSFIIFQLIKNGAMWNDYQFLLIDTMHTMSRVFHGLYALSRVDLASKSFLDSIRKPMRGGDLKMKSQLIKKMMMLKPINLRIGPCMCNQDLPLCGGALYTDNLITTALWP
ncbi:unnamed protein product [Orchesella dallaii]|uniref:Odorant receptor n=1 Tax=Orchesella dallaii TaxID=48710 RepID=A0ABP1R401_9HEXA